MCYIMCGACKTVHQSICVTSCVEPAQSCVKNLALRLVSLSCRCSYALSSVQDCKVKSDMCIVSCSFLS